MTELTIFKQQGAVSTGKRELSDLAKSLAGSGGTYRRIQTNTNGTFKRLINGEQVGDAIRQKINVIIVSALPKVSRVFYKAKYDPNAEATMPDCWSNLGDKPEASASNKQAVNCTICPQNISGSGDNGGRACRYQRRIAVMVEGDEQGDVYQLNIPAKSLFGKGHGNVHPFESYVRFLATNGESVDRVVTEVSYDLNADTMTLVFTPLRQLSDEEIAMADEAASRPETKAYTALTVAAVDKVSKQPELPLDEPVKRQSKKDVETAPAAKPVLSAVIGDWADEE
jgi:hypothetical protein